MNYKQCMLEKKEDSDIKIATTWLPEKYAIKGKMLKLEDRETKQWEDGWKVVLIGTKTLTEEEVIARSQDHKTQRKASDI